MRIIIYKGLSFGFVWEEETVGDSSDPQDSGKCA